MMQYNQLWFETMWDTRKEDETKELWKKEFRMSVEKFQYLLDLIGINAQRLDNRFWKGIKIEKSLAMLYGDFLQGGTCRSVSKVFGVVKSIVIKIFQDRPRCSTSLYVY